MQGSGKTGMNYKSDVERQQGRPMDIKPFDEGLRRRIEMERIREISVCPLWLTSEAWSTTKFSSMANGMTMRSLPLTRTGCKDPKRG